MDNVKLSATFYIKGNKFLSEEEAGKDINNYEHYSLRVETRDKKNKKEYTTIKYSVPKCIPVSQVINMTDIAYKAMITECPEWSTAHSWKKMNKYQRIEAHLDRLMSDLNGVSYNYNIFD